MAASWDSFSCSSMLVLVSSSMPRSIESTSSWPGSCERANTSTTCGRPSSRTMKSSAWRSVTSRPWLSRTVTVTFTISRSAENVGVTWRTGGAAASSSASTATGVTGTSMGPDGLYARATAAPQDSLKLTVTVMITGTGTPWSSVGV